MTLLSPTSTCHIHPWPCYQEVHDVALGNMVNKVLLIMSPQEMSTNPIYHIFHIYLLGWKFSHYYEGGSPIFFLK